MWFILMVKIGKYGSYGFGFLKIQNLVLQPYMPANSEALSIKMLVVNECVLRFERKKATVLVRSFAD